MQSLILHAHAGPNPWKVALILESLSLPWTHKVWATEDQKKPPFTTTLNPNGFTPVLEDPNNGIKIWESGAIIQYILTHYDTSHKISFPASSIKESALLLQYSFFQATFQGPNLSAALYFTRTANPAARKRYIDESLRVLEVLEGELGLAEGSGDKWLVGGKMSAADLVFVPYFWSMPLIMGEEMPDMEKTFPNVNAWFNKISAMESVQKIVKMRGVALAKLGAPPVASK